MPEPRPFKCKHPFALTKKRKVHKSNSTSLVFTQDVPRPTNCYVKVTKPAHLPHLCTFIAGDTINILIGKAGECIAEICPQVLTFRILSYLASSHSPPSTFADIAVGKRDDTCLYFWLSCAVKWKSPTTIRGQLPTCPNSLQFFKSLPLPVIPTNRPLRAVLLL